MKGLFNSENWFWQRMADLADLMILSVIWLVCCIPVVTIGPATSSLLYVMQKKVRDEADEGIWKLYWRAFRRDIKPSIIVGVIVTVLGVLLYFDIHFYANAQGVLRPVFGSLTVVFGVALLLLSPYVFALVSWFNNTVPRYFLSAFYLSLRFLLRTLVMLVITAAAVVAVYMMPPALILAPGLAALGQAAIQAKIFDRYVPAEGEDGEKTDEATDEATETDQTGETEEPDSAE